MANFVKIGHKYLNLDTVQCIEDLFTSTREDKVVARFGAESDETQTFTGREADDLRTWLNSISTNLHAATDLDTSG